MASTSKKPATATQLKRQAEREAKASKKAEVKQQKRARDTKLDERRAGVDNKKVRYFIAPALVKAPLLRHFIYRWPILSSVFPIC